MTRSKTSLGLALAGIAFAAGCAAFAPLAVKFGADLISSATTNYSQKYANKVEDLMQGMYAKALHKEPQQTASADPYGSAYSQAPGAYPTSGAYPSQSDPYQSTAGNSPYPSAAGISQSPYPSSPYPSTAQSPYPAQASPYPSTAQSPYPAQASAYPSTGQDPYSSAGAVPAGAIVLEAAILAQRASDRAARRTDPVPIQDGDTLRDGGSDPRKGDVMKFSFRVNCDCYVYVIGADATGYIAKIFPDPASGLTNPVRAGQQYVVPGGTAWYGLDQYKGVEQVFFLASRAPRQDIEGTLAQLAQTPRTAPPPQNYRGVREPVVSDATRGLVKVQMGTPSTVQGESGQKYTFTPQAFVAQGDDVVVTKWFNHQ